MQNTYALCRDRYELCRTGSHDLDTIGACKAAIRYCKEVGPVNRGTIMGPGFISTCLKDWRIFQTPAQFASCRNKMPAWRSLAGEVLLPEAPQESCLKVFGLKKG